MPGFNLGLNSYGRVAGGVEGSGQAQIVQPYDASKFAKIELAQKEKEKEEKAKGMKDARAFKPEEFEKVNEYWVEDAKFYSNETQAITKDMTGNTMQYYNNLATIKDPDALYEANLKVAEDRSRINARVKHLNEEVTLGMQNKEFYEKSQALYDSDQNKWDADETEARRYEFLNIETRPDLIEQAGGNKQAARRLLVAEYDGSLVAERWDQAKHTTTSIASNEARATTTTSGFPTFDLDKGMIYQNKSTNTYHNLQQAVDHDMNIIQNSRQYQKFLKSNPKLRDDIQSYYGNKPIDEMPEGELLKWAAQSDAYKNFVKGTYLGGDETSYVRTASQSREGGSGLKKLDENAPIIKTDLQTFLSGMSVPGASSAMTDKEKKDNAVKISIWNDFKSALQTDSAGNFGNVAGLNPQPYAKGDQMSANATVAKGKGFKAYDPLTGQEITNQIDVAAYKEVGQGFATNIYIANKPFTYTDAKGKVVRVDVGDELPEQLIQGKKPLDDYTTKMVYYGTAQGNPLSSENLNIIFVQDQSGYTNQTENADETQWNNDKVARKQVYNSVMIDGQPAGDWIQKKAIEYGGDTPENWERAEREAMSKVGATSTSTGVGNSR
jgi:hypothetical protein